METAFTPYVSLFGGVLIGIAAVLMMLMHGRIFGATGILAGAIFERGQEQVWRILVIVGMITAPAIYLLIAGRMPTIDVPITTPAIIIGGFLVGVGVTFGAGCTSGHGVCGIARFSPRSIVATITFMIAAIVTVYIIRHIIGAA
ncbi:membrane protein [Amylibacter ulvae]|uniref:Membrane protein n=1 Tax=Paramylibacter ulvae TaxID=1651968 RepID=A0ABQ3D5X1_9RHOB|nr:YeeE/YedE family protein [Amylibacter ulvae]GHA57273.1 membrane protein [Amylibacter ulvae]